MCATLNAGVLSRPQSTRGGLALAEGVLTDY